jgi:hypothetical protein
MVVAFSLALCALAPSVALAGISASFQSVDAGFGKGLYLTGSSPTVVGPVLGGILNWSASSAMGGSLTMWNGRSGFASTHFASVGLEIANNPALAQMQTFQAKMLDDLPLELGTHGTLSPLAASYIGVLWKQHIQDVVNSANTGFDGPRRTMIGAFQTAIWKLTYDQGLNFDLNSGNLVANSGDATRLAQRWLNDLQAAGPNAPKANLVALLSPGNAPQIVEASVIAQTLVDEAVPEPTTFVAWLLLGSMGVVVGRRYPRAKRAASASRDC